MLKNVYDRNLSAHQLAKKTNKQTNKNKKSDPEIWCGSHSYTNVFGIS